MKHTDECLYDILGVRPDCTLRQIRVAYKKLALAHHPDRFKTAEDKKKAHENFARINNAHQILGDSEARALYDAMRNMKSQASGNGQSSKPTGNKSPPGAPPSYTSGASAHRERPNSNHHSSRSSPGFSGEDQQNRRKEKPRHSSRQYHQRTRNGNYNSSTSWDRPKTRSHHDSRKSSSTPKSPNSHGKTSAEDRQDYNHQGQRQKVYGTCQDGRPCLRCISQNKFCYQHRSQDPNQAQDSQHNSNFPGGERARNANNDHNYKNSSSYNSGNRIFGVNKNGKPCKRCSKSGNFCYQHESQRYKGSSANKGNGPSMRPPPGPSTGCGSGPFFGVNQNGQYCKRCIKQCSFCYQHKYQEQRQ